MRVQKILYAVKPVVAIGTSAALYLIMIWGMTAIYPMPSNGRPKISCILIGWAVLISAWYGYLKVWRSRTLKGDRSLISLLLGTLYVLFFIVSFLFNGVMLLFGGYGPEQVSAGFGCVFSMAVLFYLAGWKIKI